MCALFARRRDGNGHSISDGEEGPGFSLQLEVDGVIQSVPLQLNADGTGFEFPSNVDPGFSFPGGDVIQLTEVNGVFDPVLNLAAGVTDAGAPSTFGFSLSSGLAPFIFGPAPYTTNFIATFTDGASNGGSIEASGAQIFGVMDAEINGSPIAGLGVAPAVLSTPLDVYGPFAGGGVFACPGGGCTSFGIAFGFDGSGGGDTYALNGRFELVPEPSTALLMGLGLIGLAGARQRSR